MSLATQVEALQCQIVALQSQIVALEHRLATYRICPLFGILTRTAIEEIWSQQKTLPNLAIGFLDVDDLKHVNLALGYDEVNKRLAEAFRLVREGETIARFFSGDELIILAPQSSILAICHRVQAALKSQGMSATIVATLYQGQDSLAEAAQSANRLVQQCKLTGKGQVYDFLGKD